MRASTNEFQEYLAPDESVIDADSGTLVDNSRRTEGWIGVTDRRLLFVSDDGGYVDVAQAGISGIRSQPRTTFTARGIRYRLVAAASAFLAVAAFLGSAVLTSNALGATLLLVSVGGFVLAEHVRRNGTDVVWTALETVDARLPDGFDGVSQFRERVEGARDVDDQHLILGFACLALAALIGPVALAGSLLVLLLMLVALGGIGVADYAYRHERELAGGGGSQRHVREVSVHLVGGNIVRLRVDSAKRLDRALSRVAGERMHEQSRTTSPRS